MPESEVELGELADMIGVELRIAQIMADQAFREIKAPKMASGHYTVLAILRLNPGLNQSAIARSLHLKRSSMVPILDKFVDQGWIERRPKTADRRSYAVYLTQKGKKILQQVDERVRGLEAEITERMGKENRDHLLVLLRQFQSIILDQ